jgi:hypothetical protein
MQVPSIKCIIYSVALMNKLHVQSIYGVMGVCTFLFVPRGWFGCVRPSKASPFSIVRAEPRVSQSVSQTYRQIGSIHAWERERERESRRKPNETICQELAHFSTQMAGEGTCPKSASNGYGSMNMKEYDQEKPPYYSSRLGFDCIS